MSFLQNLSDNNTAILGCAGLLLTAFVLMSASYHVGVIVRGGRSTASRTSPEPRIATAAPKSSETTRRAA